MYEPPPGHRKPGELRDEDKGNIFTKNTRKMFNVGPLHTMYALESDQVTFEQLLAFYIDVATTLLVRLHDFKVESVY